MKGVAEGHAAVQPVMKLDQESKWAKHLARQEILLLKVPLSP